MTVTELRWVQEVWRAVRVQWNPGPSVVTEGEDGTVGLHTMTGTRCNDYVSYIRRGTSSMYMTGTRAC